MLVLHGHPLSTFVMKVTMALDELGTHGLGAPPGPAGRLPRPPDGGRGRQMTERNITHGTFSLERTYDAPRSRVYAAFATLEGKQA